MERVVWSLMFVARLGTGWPFCGCGVRIYYARRGAPPL